MNVKIDITYKWEGITQMEDLHKWQKILSIIARKITFFAAKYALCNYV